MAPRFIVTYFVRAEDEAEAKARALDIALEQTVEIPRSVVPKGYVEDEILAAWKACTAIPRAGRAFSQRSPIRKTTSAATSFNSSTSSSATVRSSQA